MDSKQTCLEWRKAEAASCRELGNFHFKNGHYDAAIFAYVEGLKFAKDDLLLHCNLAQAYIKLKQYHQACCHASAAIELDPTYWKGYARLAKGLYEIGQRVESIEVLMQGFGVCDQKEELQKCFYHIPATSDEESAAKAAKKLKKLFSEGAKKKEAEKKCQKSSTSNKKMDKNQNTVSVETVVPAPTTTFETLLKDGYEEAQKGAFSKALEFYKKALKIREEVPLKYLGFQEKQCIVLTYILNLMRIQTATFENLQQTISDLKITEEVGHFRILPAFHYIRSLAYFKLNRFKVAIEELESCIELISLKLPFIQLNWPCTSVVIRETNKEGLQDAINDLMMQAKSCLHNVPTAVCRFSQCHEVSSHFLPSEQIFVTDPDFVGYVTITCEEKCHVQYHLHCWKAYRERLSEFEKIADKDMLGKPCPTTDCLNSAGNQSSILLIEIYGQDGAIKTQMKLDPIAATGKQQSKNKKKREDSKSEDKKDKEKVPKVRKPSQRRKSQSDKKSVEQKSAVKPKKEPEEIFNGKMAQLINLRAINFGCASNSWNPNEAFYGRLDEKEVSNSFVLKRVDNPLFVPDHNDHMTVIRMKFYKLLRKESFLPIETIEEHWNDDDEFSSEIRNSLNGSSIVDFLLQSTLFALLDDLMCLSENLPEAYKETEESLQQSVAFMIEGFTETVEKTKKPEEPKASGSNEKMNEPNDDDDVDVEYNSESAEDSDGESFECYVSSENEDCQSELEDENEEVADLDKPPEHKEDESRGSPVHNKNEDPNKIQQFLREQSVQTEIVEENSDKNSIENLKKKIELFNENFTEKNKTIDSLKAELSKYKSLNQILREQAVQTENNEENSDKNVIENLKKKIELFNANFTEKTEKIDELTAELSKSNSINQKLETENTKLLNQNEKLNKKITNQTATFQKKEAALTKENEQLKSDGNAFRDKLEIREKEMEKLLVTLRQKQLDSEQYQKKLEQSVRDLQKDNEQLKFNSLKIETEGFLLALEMLEKRCHENIVGFDVLSSSSRLTNYSKIKDALAEWNKFKLKLNAAKNAMQNTMPTNGTNSKLYKLIGSIQEEEPKSIFNTLKVVRDLSNTTVQSATVQSEMPNNIEPQKPSKPVNGKVNNSKTDEVPIVSAAAVTSSQTDDDSASSSTHSVVVLPNLPRSESTQPGRHSAQGYYSHETASGSAAAAVLTTHSQKSADSPNDGVWEVSGKHSNRSKPDLLHSTSFTKKRQFSVLKENLQKLHPNKTESELEECIRTVRARNNNSLTGLRLNEIEYRVGKLLEERSKKPSTMGLDKFGKVGWSQINTTENNWSGNIELEDCIICSEEIDHLHCTTLECNHYFHTECIRKWLKEKSICPLCTTFTKMPDEFPAL
ncbi:hypothetical protein LSTR_LSTR007552 [Laodelphax striatellus]|uniref:RING-type domain-containing protein n=1 Tax=Laodelphax striatellus TaxID=195883 RepID=A0A482XQG2_LAOST|nr:hypothetical protein LSTR_LSTR007552 [Laodelphax striatellus]